VLDRLARRQHRAVGIGQGGFFGPDRPANAVALQVASNRGLDLHSHRSRLVTAEDVAAASLVLVMEPAHARRLRRDYGAPSHEPILLGDLDPGPGAGRVIRDPYGRAPEVFEKTFDQIDRCVSVLVDLLPSGGERRERGAHGEIGVE